MCGIVGRINLEQGEPVPAELIEKMCASLAHRGPDDSGVYTDGHIALGHRRLSIQDLSSAARQPMSMDGNVWITFNGEIYNFLELRKSLEELGYSFKTTSDTEVILALYREYGEDCLSRLRGMFAFAIWDKPRKRLFLARDRVGKKPLYYYNDGRKFVFASEIKAILQNEDIDKKINGPALYDYFTYGYIPDPKSIFENILKLEPGHYIVIENSSFRKNQYWDLSFRSITAINEEALAEELLAILYKSVKLRMISDVPLGAFLSGGIDSSAVVALMSQAATQDVTTFTIGFDSPEFDEVHFARSTASIFKTKHNEFTVKQNVLNILPMLAREFDEPFADPSSVPTYYISQVARRVVTVALSGDGGDEAFAGYNKYHLDALENKFRSLIPSFVRHLAIAPIYSALSRYYWTLPSKPLTLMRALASSPDRGFYLSNSIFPPLILRKLFTPEAMQMISGYDPFSVIEGHYNKADADDHLSRILYADMKTYLPGDILVKADRMSMAHSLELRAPFLDHELLETVAQIPYWLKYQKGQKKYILKKAMAPLLSEDILTRKKMGFTPPTGEWFRTELKQFTEETLLSPDSRITTYFDPDAVRRVWERHQLRKRDCGVFFWTLLMFELWHREYLG
jgi:asparagine synthase (glutamine-hydrolysing)